MSVAVGAYELGELLGAVSFGKRYGGVHSVTGHRRSIVRLAPGPGSAPVIVAPPVLNVTGGAGGPVAKPSGGGDASPASRQNAERH